ncbi:general stress protein [Kallotenue papyrolyticum]|uniref:general stress protein n=1 Tax=Kallotenue papyrolyticum TaxID=1325125 RepID=UPI000478604B|nr:general stress protein [Kallotenue papyrolyticum]
MAKNVVGLFDTRQDAEDAVRALRDAGFPANDISLVAGNTREYDEFTTAPAESGTEAEEGAGIGATGGAVLGGLAGLLVGLGVLTIPGVGPVVAAGSLATVLGSTALGAGIGAAAGGLVGALVGAGIPEEEANIYAESIRRGGTLVMVQVASDEEADRAAEIMDRYNVVDIDERGRTYRESGWERFDESGAYIGVSPASTGYRGTSDYEQGTGATYTSTTDYERVGGTASTDTNATTYPRATGMEGLRSESTPRAEGDADTTIDRDDYERSSKVGTAGGAVAGAVTGAAMGSAGGPVGTVIGGAAGAVTGGAIGAAGDAAGAEASDEDRDVSAVDRDTTRDPATAYGSARDYSASDTTDDRSDTTWRDESMTDRIERATNLDIDRDRDVGGTPRRDI